MSALAQRLGSPVGRMQRRAPVLQIVAVVLLFVYGAATIDGYSATSSIDSMLVLAALLGIAAAGQTLVVILGGLDLSVPGIIVGASIVVSELYGTHHWPAVAAIALVVAVAAVMGALSGRICHRYEVQPLVVTLGMGALASGGALAWTGGQLNGHAPGFLTTLTSATSTTFGLTFPPLVAIWGLLAIALGLFLHRTATGRRLYAIGANPRAAQLARIRTGRIRIGVLAASAVFSALVGVLLAGFAGEDPTIGSPYLFQGLSAVVVGGTVFLGARGDYSHTVLGALILTQLTTILVGKGYDSADQQIIFGLLILAVVAGYGRDRKLRDLV